MYCIFNKSSTFPKKINVYYNRKKNWVTIVIVYRQYDFYQTFKLCGQSIRVAYKKVEVHKHQMMDNYQFIDTQNKSTINIINIRWNVQIFQIFFRLSDCQEYDLIDVKRVYIVRNTENKFLCDEKSTYTNWQVTVL